MVLPSVVVVDDAPEVRALVRTVLEVSDRLTVVGEAADGAAAVSVVAELQPDLVLLDVSMPRMDGLQALPRIREVCPTSRVVMFTGFAEQGLADRARALGAIAFLEKSASPTDLVETLLDAVSTGPLPVSPSFAARAERLDAAVLTEHLERFREVFEDAAIGMATMTLSGHLVRVNGTLADLVGRPVEDLVGLRYDTLAGADLAAEPLRRILNGEDVVRVEHDLVGGERSVVATFVSVRDSQSRPLYVFLQMQDVTAQRGTEEELRRSEERFRLLVDAVQDYAIFMLTTDGIIASWNVGAQRIKGYTAEEIVGRHFRTFYPREQQESQHPERELEWAIRDGRYEEEGWRLRKDGSRFWANVVITAVHDADGRHIGFTKVTRDMTERQEMLNNLASMNRKLKTAADQQADFLAVTAHELRTPVSVLGGSAKLLSEHFDELAETDRAELFESMGSSALRLRRLLDDLLTASRLQSGTVEFRVSTTELAPLLAAAVSRAQGSNPGARITMAVPPDLVVDVDTDRIAQAVDNLIDNAVRHGKPPVQVTAVATADGVEICVSDAGAGVPTAQRTQLFQRFATGQRRTGTGLGLFIVRELARAHGGEARYEPPTADRPSGAFVLALPRADGPPPAGPDAAELLAEAERPSA
ncbi:PAS domain S-box protein [Sporichthya polymorpha]|uniref:PAS domain S-box protein n=1 Tax=Sporichthya polymorpha TaxID=35751 RepID=UPI00037E886A|nr:PAS domain S-box protein [Sporichthya polymorpha]